MSLGKTRRFISYLLTIIIAAGGMMLFGTAIARATMLNESYVNAVFDRSGAFERSKKDFEDCVLVLEARSSIPARVFNSVYSFSDSQSGNAAAYLFGSEDSQLYAESKTEEFEKLCKEYLDGNNMSYDSELVHNTALEATEMYSQCFLISGGEELAAEISKAQDAYAGVLSLGLLLVILPVALLLSLYRRNYEIYFNINAAFTLQGLIFMFSAIGCLILRVWQNVGLSPAAYADAYAKAVQGACAVGLVFGALLTAISLFFNIRITAKSSGGVQAA